jgi:hypothetical protein
VSIPQNTLTLGGPIYTRISLSSTFSKWAGVTIKLDGDPNVGVPKFRWSEGSIRVYAMSISHFSNGIKTGKSKR